MGASAAAGVQIVSGRPCMSASQGLPATRAAVFRLDRMFNTTARFASCPKIFCSRPLSSKHSGVVVRAMSGESASQGLPIDLRGKRAFIARVADDNGYGWAIAKALAAAGAEILVGIWVPALNIFETSLRRGKFGESRKLPDGSLMDIIKVYPLDAVYDSLEDVPEDVKQFRRQHQGGRCSNFGGATRRKVQQFRGQQGQNIWDVVDFFKANFVIIFYSYLGYIT